MDGTLAQVLSEVFRLTRLVDELRARVRELEAALAAAPGSAPPDDGEEG